MNTDTLSSKSKALTKAKRSNVLHYPTNSKALQVRLHFCIKGIKLRLQLTQHAEDALQGITFLKRMPTVKFIN